MKAMDRRQLIYLSLTPPPLWKYLTYSRCDVCEPNLQGSLLSKFHQIDNVRHHEVGGGGDLGQ